MKCPICENQLPEDVLRCSHCNSPLTVWRNLDAFAEQCYCAGLDLVSQEKSEGALEMLCRAVTFAPSNPDYLQCYGRLLAKAGRYKEAQSALESAQRISPSEATATALQRIRSQSTSLRPEKHLSTRRPLSLSLEGLVADGNGGVGPWELCFEIERNWATFARFAGILNWDFNVEANGECHPLLYLRGVHAYASHEDEKARQLFEQSVDDASDVLNPDVYLLILSKPEQLDDSVELLRTKGRDRQQLARVLNAASEIAARETRVEMITPLLIRALEFSEDGQDDLAKRLIEACQNRKQGEEAVRVLNACTEQKPSMELQLQIGDLQCRLQNEADAEVAYQKAASDFPDSWKPVQRLAHLYAQTDRSRSLACLGEALCDVELETEGRITLSRMRLQILLDMEDWRAALDDARSLVNLCPSVQDYTTIVNECEARLASEESASPSPESVEENATGVAADQNDSQSDAAAPENER